MTNWADLWNTFEAHPMPLETAKFIRERLTTKTPVTPYCPCGLQLMKHELAPERWAMAIVQRREHATQGENPIPKSTST